LRGIIRWRLFGWWFRGRRFLSGGLLDRHRVVGLVGGGVLCGRVLFGLPPGPPFVDGQANLAEALASDQFSFLAASIEMEASAGVSVL